MPRHRRAAPHPQELQAVVQAGGKAFDPKHLDARGGELDGQRQAVKPAANLDDQRGVRVGQREVFDGRSHALDEQLHGGKSRRLGGRQPGRRLRAAERCEAVLAFTRYPERFPAGRQDAYAWRSAEKRRRQAGHRLDEMLAVVEQQQHPIVSKGSDKGGKRIFGADFQTEHGRNRARHQAGVAERCQVDQPDAVFVAGDHALGDGEGDRGLADTSGPDDRHQALVRKSRGERRHRFLAADHASHCEWQIVHRRRRDRRRRRGLRWLLTSYRGDEIVTPSRNGDDVAVPVLAVAEGAAQGAHLNLEIRFFDVAFSARPARSVPLCQRPRRRARPEPPECQRRGCRAAPAGRPRAGAAVRQGAGTGQTRSRVHP